MPGMRDLYENILEYDDDELYQTLLANWVKQHDYTSFFHDVATKLTPSANYEQNELIELSWELYALSRVLDTLTLRFQPDRKCDGNWPGPDLTLDEYKAFAQSLGFALPQICHYHPFYYEIIEAKAGDENFQLTDVLFPPVMFGNLLIKRGGAVISLDPTRYDINTINNSVIYWAFRRKNRPCQDLSDGWGSNSQWRTRFRLDFDLGDRFVYNAAGEWNLNHPNDKLINELQLDSLTLDIAKELTIYRHALTPIENQDDLFPYDYCYTQ